MDYAVSLLCGMSLTRNYGFVASITISLSFSTCRTWIWRPFNFRKLTKTSESQHLIPFNCFSFFFTTLLPALNSFISRTFHRFFFFSNFNFRVFIFWRNFCSHHLNIVFLCTFLGQQFNFLNFVLFRYYFIVICRNFDFLEEILIQFIHSRFLRYISKFWAFLYVFGCNVLIFAMEFVGKIEFWGAFVGI